MQRGQPLQFSDFIPAGFSEQEVYTFLAAMASFLVVWAIGSSLTEKDRLTPRLEAIQQRRKQLKDEYYGPNKRKRAERNTDWMRDIVSRVKILKDNQIDGVNRKLVQAGMRRRDALVIYMFAKLVSPFILLFLGLLFAGIDWSQPFALESIWRWLIVLLPAYIGINLPEIVVSRARKKRYYRIQQGLSDTLDMLLICAEAGLSLAAALDRVARELGQAYPEMAEELSLTSVELGILPDRNTALKHLSDRVDMQEMRSAVNVLIQTEKYGTPIAQALRVLSKDFRTERMLRAEQKAARLPALLTVPMIVFILPTLFIIIMTPAIISIMDTPM
jgi:tight adherence protein C